MHQIASDWRAAGLGPADVALCTYAEKLTQRPTAMLEDDIIVLRESGFDDRAIHDATQVISFFNYINRMADALNVEPETFTHEWEKSAPA